MSTRAPLPMCAACDVGEHEECSADMDLDDGPPCACACRDVREPFYEGGIADWAINALGLTEEDL